jgi:hypothetical protein
LSLFLLRVHWCNRSQKQEQTARAHQSNCSHVCCLHAMNSCAARSSSLARLLLPLVIVTADARYADFHAVRATHLRLCPNVYSRHRMK